MTSHAPVCAHVTKVKYGEACEDLGYLVYLIAFWILQLIYWQNFELLCISLRPTSQPGPGVRGSRVPRTSCLRDWHLVLTSILSGLSWKRLGQPCTVSAPDTFCKAIWEKFERPGYCAKYHKWLSRVLPSSYISDNYFYFSVAYWWLQCVCY
jgi:hypothetical protein